MKRSLLIFAVTLCVLTACRSNRDRLMEINGFLNDNRLDTAQACLNHVNPSALSGYDKALYNLISVKLNHLQYRPLTSDTLIRSCINVFTEYDDKERLAESLYYKAVTDYEKGNVPQAFKEMKRAEATAKGINDMTVQHKIIESLTDWNMSEHQYQLAMSYGRRNLALSTKAGNNNWIAYALVFMSQTYAGMGQRDSADHYLDRCISYMKDVPDSQRVDFYNYIAALTIKNDLHLAYSYTMKGNAIRENSMGYATLAQIRFREGDGNAVDSLCNKALRLAKTPAERIYVLQQAMSLYEAQNRFDQAYRASKELMAVKNREMLQREKHNVNNVQSTYDYMINDLRFRQALFYALIIIAFLILIAAFFFIYHRFCMCRNSKESMQNQLLINIYGQRIEEFKSSNQDMQTSMKELNDKLTVLHQRQADILFEGCQLYNQITNGGTTVRWSKTDFIHFIEYYRIIDLPFVAHLEDDYNRLSPRYQFFMILYQMGMDDQRVARIMGVGDSTVRSIKTRVKWSVK